MRADVFVSRQNGAALIVVLILMVMAAMLAVTGLQDGITNEKLAGNYRAASLAQMAAEKAAAEGSKQHDPEADELGFSTVSWDKIVGNLDHASPDCSIVNKSLNVKCVYLDSKDSVVAVGRVVSDDGSIIAESAPVIVSFGEKDGGGGGGGGPFDGVVGCDGVGLSGGPMIDSYDSRLGGYGETVSKDGGSFYNGKGADVKVKTIKEGAGLELKGHSPIYGDLNIAGDLIMRGQTPLYGNAVVGGNAEINGKIGGMDGSGKSVGGDLSVMGNVTVGNAGVVQGKVSANGDMSSSGKVEGDIEIGGNADFSSSSVTNGGVIAEGNVNIGSTGSPPQSVRAGGSISYPSWWQYNDTFSQLASSSYHQGSNVNVGKFSGSQGEGQCDALSVLDENGSGPGKFFSETLSGNSTVTAPGWFDSHGCEHCYSSNSKGINLTGGKGNKDASETVIGEAGKSLVMEVDGDLSTGGRLRKIRVKGDIVLVVNGDFDIGNNTQLVVDKDASLEVLVTGKTTLSGGSNLLTSNALVRKGQDGKLKPALSIFSAYRSSGKNDAGVEVSGANDSYVNIYAPGANVEVTGSGSIYGAVRGKEVNMSGSGDIHYDEALLDVYPQNSGDYGVISWKQG